MYTIEEIKNVVFTRAGRGYRTDEVDEFIEEVVRTMEAMQQNSDALVQKLGVLADKIEDYRAQEDSIHSALLTAQRMADQVMKEAQTNADKLKEESESRAAQLESDARRRASALTEQAEQDYQTKLADTKQQATRVIAEAKDRSGRMLFEALEKSRAERAALEEMKRQTQSFKDQLVAMYQEQMALIQRLASQERVIPAPPVPAEQSATDDIEEVSMETVQQPVVPQAPADDNQVMTDAPASPESIPQPIAKESEIIRTAPESSLPETVEPAAAAPAPEKPVFEAAMAAPGGVNSPQPAVTKAPGTAPAVSH